VANITKDATRNKKYLKKRVVEGGNEKWKRHPVTGFHHRHMIMTAQTLRLGNCFYSFRNVYTRFDMYREMDIHICVLKRNKLSK
jgi:hypothetical protein